MKMTVCLLLPESGSRVDIQLPVGREPLLCVLRAGGIKCEPGEIFLESEGSIRVGLKGEDVHPILPLIRWEHTLEDLNLYAAMMDALPRSSAELVYSEIRTGNIKTLDEATMKCHELAMKLGSFKELFCCSVRGIPVGQTATEEDGDPLTPELLHQVQDVLRDLWKAHAGTYPVPLGTLPALGDSLLAVSWNVVPGRGRLEGYVECLLTDHISPEQRSALANWIDEQNKGAFGKLMSEHPIETDTCDLVLSWGPAVVSEINEIDTISRGI